MASDPGILDFPDIRRGNTLTGHLRIFRDGLPVNFTTATALMQFRKKKNDPVGLELTIGNGLTGDADGNLHIFKDFDVEQERDTVWIYDLEITEADGFRFTPVEGQILAIQDISRK